MDRDAFKGQQDQVRPPWHAEPCVFIVEGVSKLSSGVVLPRSLKTSMQTRACASVLVVCVLSFFFGAVDVKQPRDEYTSSSRSSQRTSSAIGTVSSVSAVYATADPQSPTFRHFLSRDDIAALYEHPKLADLHYPNPNEYAFSSQLRFFSVCNKWELADIKLREDHFWVPSPVRQMYTTKRQDQGTHSKLVGSWPPAASANERVYEPGRAWNELDEEGKFWPFMHMHLCPVARP